MSVIPDNLRALTVPGTFALLAALTRENEIILKPINANENADIIEAIQEIVAEHPGCKMRLFEHNYNSWKRYFEGVVPREQLL